MNPSITLRNVETDLDPRCGHLPSLDELGPPAGWPPGLCRSYLCLYELFDGTAGAEIRGHRDMADVLQVGKTSAARYTELLAEAGILDLLEAGTSGLIDQDPDVTRWRVQRPSGVSTVCCSLGHITLGPQDHMDTISCSPHLDTSAGVDNGHDYVARTATLSRYQARESRWEEHAYGFAGLRIARASESRGGSQFSAAAMSSWVGFSRSTVIRRLRTMEARGEAVQESVSKKWKLKIPFWVTVQEWDETMERAVDLSQDEALELLARLEGAVPTDEASGNEQRWLRYLAEQKRHKTTTRLTYSIEMGNHPPLDHPSLCKFGESRGVREVTDW